MTDLEVNKILTGNNVDILKKFPDGCIDLTITSPPYDNLRDYNGYSFDFESVAQELFRVTKEGAVVVWVVSDATIKGSESGTSFRQALHFKEIGFNLHDTMIYQKDSSVPLTHRRYEQQFEYMFVFSKGRPKTFNGLTRDTTYHGELSKKKRKHRLADGTFKISEERTVATTALRYNVWRYNVGYMKTTQDKYAYDHPAMFPEQLAADHILSWSNEGDVVLDPFGGSGTTAKMALIHKRNYITIDISEEYNEIAKKRIEEVEKDLRPNVITKHLL